MYDIDESSKVISVREVISGSMSMEGYIYKGDSMMGRSGSYNRGRSKRECLVRGEAIERSIE